MSPVTSTGLFKQMVHLVVRYVTGRCFRNALTKSIVSHRILNRPTSDNICAALHHSASVNCWGYLMPRLCISIVFPCYVVVLHSLELCCLKFTCYLFEAPSSPQGLLDWQHIPPPKHWFPPPTKCCSCTVCHLQIALQLLCLLIPIEPPKSMVLDELLCLEMLLN